MSTINDFEREHGFLIKNLPKEYTPETEISRDDFKELIKDMSQLTDLHGVNWQDREQFLTDNGYAINRKNMINPELSAKAKKSAPK